MIWQLTFLFNLTLHWYKKQKLEIKIDFLANFKNFSHKSQNLLCFWKSCKHELFELLVQPIWQHCVEIFLCLHWKWQDYLCLLVVYLFWTMWVYVHQEHLVHKRVPAQQIVMERKLMCLHFMKQCMYYCNDMVNYIFSTV